MEMNKRIGYDSAKFYCEKSKLPEPNGTHCIICGVEFEKPDRRRRYCSQKCYDDWYDKLNINSWCDVRGQVMARDHHKCNDCDSTENLEVHHIKPICEGGNEFDLDNCITLCHDCHVKAHSKLKKEEK